MISLRAMFTFTLVLALLGCSHDLQYNYPPPHPPSQVLDISSTQDPMTITEQLPKAVDLPQIQEKPQETIPETVLEDVPVQKKVITKKRKPKEAGYEINSMVQLWIERLNVKDRDAFRSSLARLDKIRPTMERIFKQYGIPKEMVYLCLVESNANPHAVSCSGATGYWQFIPDTAKKYGLQVNRYVDERRNLEKSTHAAAQYLKQLYSIFGDWYLAIAAYNAGEGAVIRLMKNNGVKTFWDINNSMGIKAETIDYVPKYIATVILATNREAYGLPTPPQNQGDVTPEGVDSPGYMGVIARSNGSLTGSYASNNNDFTTDTLPIPAKTSKERNLKTSQAALKKGASSASEPKEDQAGYFSHTVRKGDTLYSLARKYKSSVDLIAQANGISPKKGLKMGKTIIIPDRSGSRPGNNDSRQEKVHIVAKGDTLKDISSDYGVTVDDIIRANDLKDPCRIQPKAALVIPSSQGKNASMKTIKYKVKKGDTLWGISRQFEVKTMDILRWNRLTSTAEIKPGDKLTIYHQ